MPQYNLHKLIKNANCCNEIAFIEKWTQLSDVDSQSVGWVITEASR